MEGAEHQPGQPQSKINTSFKSSQHLWTSLLTLVVGLFRSVLELVCLSASNDGNNQKRP